MMERRGALQLNDQSIAIVRHLDTPVARAALSFHMLFRPKAQLQAWVIAVAYCAGTADQSSDQPLLVTTDRHSPIRTRRSLYEALLQLEQQGVVVVERALSHVDVALSPSTCLCIWTEQALLQESHVFLLHRGVARLWPI